MNNKSIILKKILLFAAIMFVLDFILGYGLKKVYFSQTSGVDYRTTFVTDSVKSDILILGSSRASHHYNLDILEDSLKLTAYNGGRDGCKMFYYYAMLKCVLKRYHPKVVVLDLRPLEFEIGEDGYDRLNVLLPYYDNHPEIRSICLLRSKYERCKLVSKIYPYNSKLFTLMNTVLNLKQNAVDEAKLKGYLGLDHQFNDAKPSQRYTNKIDTAIVNCFKTFVSDCKTAGINLIVTVSPVFMNEINNNSTVDVAKKLCMEQNIPFYSYTSDPKYNNHKLFADPDHLNNTGAAQFTNMFVSRVRAAIRSK